jgi:hypothetical protein
LDIGNFLQSIGDKVSKIMVPNSILQDLISIKIAIGLIAISLLISSLALLVLALSHSRLKKTQKSPSDQILDCSLPPHD